MRRRLAILMFLQYAILGAFVPLFSVWLNSLGFSPLAMAWTFATSAMASLVAPLLAGQIADRWVPAERCIGACALCAGGMLWLLADLTEADDVFWVCLAAWFFLIPILTLGVSLSFRHLEHPEQEFGRVRLWGTVGWIVPGLLLGCWFYSPPWLAEWLDALRGEGTNLGDCLRLGAMLSWTMAVYSLTLPHTPPVAPRVGTTDAARFVFLQKLLDAPLVALRLFRQRAFAVFFACAFGLYVTIPFSSQMSPLLLKALGMPEWLLPLALTVAQWTEVVTLALLPMLLLRLQLRGTMLLGLSSWAAGLVLQSLGTSAALVTGALALNGMCIGCFLVAGQLHLNRAARADVRASAQGLLTLVSGSGLLAGHFLVAWVRRLTEDDLARTFVAGAGLALALVLIFGIGFPGPTKPHNRHGPDEDANQAG